MPINDKMPCGDPKSSFVVSRERLACRDGCPAESRSPAGTRMAAEPAGCNSNRMAPESGPDQREQHGNNINSARPVISACGFR